MTLPWYPRDMGKYARDTGTLTLIQHGAYNLLLDHYYSTGPINAFEQCSSNASLMPDHSPLYCLCKATSKQEQEAVDFVIRKYFKLNEDGFYRHDHCDKVIEKQNKTHMNRVNAGKQKGKKAKLKQCSSNAPQTKKETKTKTVEEEDILAKNRFEEFWKIYPNQRKGNRQKAGAAYKRAVKRAVDGEEEILRGLEAYRASAEVLTGFAKGAEAWLNDDRWTVDYTVTKQNKKTYSDEIMRAGQMAMENLSQEAKIDEIS